MADHGSITLCIEALKRGERDAAEVLWGRYFHRLAALARARLRAAPCRAADEEDVALSAFDSVCRRAAQGGFPRLEDRDDLWRLLATITFRKAIALAGRERRPRHGAGQVRCLSELDLEELERMAGPEPTPELAAEAVEACQRLLDLLGDVSLRRVALRKLEGYTNAEIAAELGCVEATIERKLQRIRGLWAREVES
ncbi:MAG TPA: ECF-type sigma factor [Isosphaeraceae bacterium]|jgi:DNA-directed RNA polymerase specialized sigma24 family protein